MPHIRAVFVDSQEMREFLRAQKTKIREIVADKMGYPCADVALYPHRISEEEVEFADNVLPLEFVVDSGSRSLGKEDEQAENIRGAILAQCDGAPRVHFGIWIVSHARNGFVENKPG